MTRCGRLLPIPLLSMYFEDCDRDQTHFSNWRSIRQSSCWNCYDILSVEQNTDMFGCGAVVLFTMTKTTQFQGVRGVLKRSAEKGEQRLVLVYGEAKTRIIRGRELESLLVTNWLPARAGAMRSQRSEEGWVWAGCAEGKGKKSRESRWRWTSEDMGLTIVEARLAVGRNTSEERSSHIRWFESIAFSTFGMLPLVDETILRHQLLKSPSWWCLMFHRGARDPTDHSPALLFCKSESDSSATAYYLPAPNSNMLINY